MKLLCQAGQFRFPYQIIVPIVRAKNAAGAGPRAREVVAKLLRAG